MVSIDQNKNLTIAGLSESKILIIDQYLFPFLNFRLPLLQRMYKNIRLFCYVEDVLRKDELENKGILLCEHFIRPTSLSIFLVLTANLKLINFFFTENPERILVYGLKNRIIFTPALFLIRILSSFKIIQPIRIFSLTAGMGRAVKIIKQIWIFKLIIKINSRIFDGNIYLNGHDCRICNIGSNYHIIRTEGYDENIKTPKLGQLNTHPKFIYFGRLERKKGVIIASNIAKYSNIEVGIYGPKGDVGADDLPILDNLHIHEGYYEKKIINCYDAILCFSEYGEGSPVVWLEAIMSGVLVLSMDNPPTRRLAQRLGIRIYNKKELYFNIDKFINSFTNNKNTLKEELIRQQKIITSMYTHTAIEKKLRKILFCSNSF
jgi:glycosyltransferase involved in cell wall biosynthesis